MTSDWPSIKKKIDRVNRILSIFFLIYSFELL